MTIKLKETAMQMLWGKMAWECMCVCYLLKYGESKQRANFWIKIM